MKPPICNVCHRLSGDGALVSFADFRPLPAGMVGHPHGLEWFCAAHLGAATALSQLPIDDAMRLLRLKNSAPTSESSLL